MTTPRIADSYYGHIVHLLDLRTDAMTDAACLFLEMKGQRFCVDYGTENAVMIAEGFNGWKSTGLYRNAMRLQ